jgi:hypothetical protein
MSDTPIAVVVVSALLALLLFATSSGKLAGAKASLQIRDALSLSAGQWRLIGAIELPIAIALVVGVWVHPVGLAARAGVCALMLGAIAARVRAGGEQRNAGVAFDVVVLVLAAASLFA